MWFGEIKEWIGSAAITLLLTTDSRLTAWHFLSPFN
jgi:hypothetical protein